MKPYLVETLKELALLGAIKNKIEISSQELAKQLDTSQQTASRYLLELDKEEIVLAVPADHPHAQAFGEERSGKGGFGTLTYADLRKFRNDNWMLSNKESMHRNLTDDILHKVGFFPERVLLETSSTTPHIAAVEAGIAVSLVPIPKKTGPNTRLFHLEPKLYRTLYAAYRKSYILSESQRVFIDSIREYYRSEKNDLE